jgi:four helix bundle protein
MSKDEGRNPIDLCLSNDGATRLPPFVIGHSIVIPKGEIMSEELKLRTKEFAHRCVKLAMALPDMQLGNHIRGQLIRCSTSVAANYRAACLAQSRAGFISKISIVIEEADESYFWLEFIVDENMIKKDLVDPLLKEAYELTAIFITSRKTDRNDKGMTNVE